MENIEDINEHDAQFVIPVELDERQRLVDMSHIYEVIPSVELEFDFNNLTDFLNTLRNHQILNVLNCPSMDDALNSIPRFMRAFFIRFHSALCVHFVINDEIYELNDIEFMNFYESLKGFSKSFLLIFERGSDNSSLIYWRLKGTEQIFSLLTNANEVRYCDFLKDFLFKSLKNQHKGILECIDYPMNKIRVFVMSSYLADVRGYDLLFLAAEAGNYQLVEFLINICDIKFLVDGKMAVDVAYENGHYDTILTLLKANSRFPHNFKIPKDFEMPFELVKFIEMSKKLHKAIKLEDKKEVKAIIRENSTLKFYFSIKNDSALAAAILSKSFEVYKLLMDRKFYFGHHEILSDLLSKLNETQRTELAEINAEKFQSVTDKHILIIMSNTHVGPDDDQKHARLSLVCSAFQKLNEVDELRILLEILAATRNFQIIFDFNRDHIHFLEPELDGYSTGLFKICGRICIGAIHLLDPQRAHEVLGVIIHEICHFSMFKVFDNMAKPYQSSDVITEAVFDEVMKDSKEHKNLEEIVSQAFDLYEEKQQVAELIVRYPHALGHYIDEPERVEEFEDNYPDLTSFYKNNCVPIMLERLPIIEEESEHRIRKENAKPKNFLRYYWKLLSLALLALILLATGITTFSFLAKTCTFKSCGSDKLAFCEFEKNGKAVCKCQNDWVWSSNKCYECVNNTDSDCQKESRCYQNRCFDRTVVFICNNGERMFSNVRCDGIKDCKDGSDEEYHCLPETLLSTTVIDDRDYLYKGPLNENIPIITAVDYFKIAYLPVNISKTFPNLTSIRFNNCAIQTILKANLAGSKQLRFLDLEDNQINSFELHSFDDLINLDSLNLSSNKITSIPDELFDKLENLRRIRLSYNKIIVLPPGMLKRLSNLQYFFAYTCNISQIPKGFFENNENINEIDLSINKITTIDEDAFKGLQKLTQLKVKDNRLNNLPDNLFRDLYSLQDLVLSDNNIKELTLKLLSPLKSLEYINIDSNKLTHLQKDLFKECQFLQYVGLFDNLIVEIDVELFDNLRFLMFLNLKGNDCTGKYYRVHNGYLTPDIRKELKNDLIACKNLT